MRAPLLAFALIAALVAASPATACSRPPPFTDAQIEAFVLGDYRAAAGLVEIEVLTDATFETPGTARVVRVHKGDVAVGRLYRMRGNRDSCSPGNFMTAGMRGWMYVGASEPEEFPGLLSADAIRILRRNGVELQR
ncbi:MAG TPA: hypothetical protein VEC11_17770 [Allosphingosinicella sp.]|nr:hypothetical protein [Allosphingosinicella sp.]